MALPVGTPLGTLRVVDVLDFYDGPRLFVADNAVGTHYLVLWADREAEVDVWLYVAVSNDRLDELYVGSVSLRDAYLRPEEPWIYRVTESLTEPDTFSFAVKRPAEIDPEKLPPPDDYLELDDPFSALAVTVPEGTPLPSIQKVSVHQRGKRDFSAVAKALSLWTSAAGAAVRHPLVPLAAAVGSFVIELGSEEPREVEAFFRSLHASLEQGESIYATTAQQVEIYRNLSRLFSEIVAGGLTLKVSIVRGDQSTPELVLSRGTVSSLLAQINSYLAIRLVSTDVPQADDIRRVFRLVELIDRGNIGNSEQLEVTPRQVAYYKHAARALGFLDHDNFVTSQGRRLVTLSASERLRVTKSAFEGSAVGFAWLKWANVTALENLDPDNAYAFLSDVVVNLSENTRRRRAVTLRAWTQALCRDT